MHYSLGGQYADDACVVHARLRGFETLTTILVGTWLLVAHARLRGFETTWDMSENHNEPDKGP